MYNGLFSDDFPQTAFAATKAAVEKAGEAFVAGMTETAEAEEVLSEEELRQQIVDFALQFEGNPMFVGQVDKRSRLRVCNVCVCTVWLFTAQSSSRSV